MIKPTLVKEGIELPIEIISDAPFTHEQVFKTQIHSTIGKNNSYEFIEKGDRKLEIKVYLENQNEYDQLIAFFEDGKPFLLNAPFFPLEPLNLDGNISSEPHYKGFSIATLRFTTAENVNFTTDNLFILGVNSETLPSEKTFLEKMQDFGKKTFDFVGSTNQAIGKVTNEIGAYADAMTNITQGLASSSSIITNPISSITSSANQILGGVNGFITSIYSGINAIRRLPSDIDDFINGLTATGSRLNGLFDLGNASDNAKYNTEFLLEVGNAIVDVDIANLQDNPAVVNGEFTDVEYFLNIKNKNSSAVSSLILCSILINIYKNIDGINRLSQKDLDNLRERTEKIYNKVISNEISTDLTLQLDLLRTQFFKIFRRLTDNALKTYFYRVNEPEFLVDIVYAVNGNLNYYEETKKLNNILGDLVFDSVEVVVD